MSRQQVAFTIRYTPDDGGYCALEPITGTTSWGATMSEARQMITEALELYFEEISAEEARSLLGEESVVNVAVCL